MNDRVIVGLIVGVPAIVGMCCILYSIFYEKDEDDIVIQYKPKQPSILLNYDNSLVEDTEYYSNEESELSNIDHTKEDALSIFDDT